MCDFSVVSDYKYCMLILGLLMCTAGLLLVSNRKMHEPFVVELQFFELCLCA